VQLAQLPALRRAQQALLHRPVGQVAHITLQHLKTWLQEWCNGVGGEQVVA
jgi:hypothetical protein